MTGLVERPLELDLDSAPARRSRLISAEIGAEIVLYDEGSDSLHLLDPVASVVWSSLDGTMTLRQVCADLADAFYTLEERVRDDVLRLVGELADRNLIAPHRSDGDVSPPR